MTSRLAFSLAAALGAAIALLSANANAQQAVDDRPTMSGPMEGDGPMGHHMTPEDREAFLDARIAAVHAGLKLTADQEKLWPPIESAIRDAITQVREQRQKMRAASEGTDKHDPIVRMRLWADRAQMVAQNLNKVADAAQPLFLSLNDDQKWRLRALLHAVRLQGPKPGMGMMRHGEDDEPPHEE